MSSPPSTESAASYVHLNCGCIVRVATTDEELAEVAKFLRNALCAGDSHGVAVALSGLTGGIGQARITVT
jgi:hypothetical protein